MSNETQKNRPTILIVFGRFLISLLFIEIIVVLIFFPGMPPVFWAIGGGSAIIGVLILIQANSIGKSGDKSKTVTSLDTEGEKLVTDEEMEKEYKKAKYMFFGGWIVSAISAAPAFTQTIRWGQLSMTAWVFALGTGFGLVGSFFIFRYKTDPEGYREFLAKRLKKK
ncbi:MAG: hypothetical protein GY870_13175 [archaeon]|nr:hypothetical protein [archaeon]